MAWYLFDVETHKEIGRGGFMFDVTKLGFFKEVVEVIGRQNAVEQLQKVVDTCHIDPEASQVVSGFTWMDSPQGHEFWSMVSEGQVPEDLPYMTMPTDGEGIQYRIEELERELARLRAIDLLKTA